MKRLLDLAIPFLILTVVILNGWMLYVVFTQ